LDAYEVDKIVTRKGV